MHSGEMLSCQDDTVMADRVLECWDLLDEIAGRLRDVLESQGTELPPESIPRLSRQLAGYMLGEIARESADVRRVGQRRYQISYTRWVEFFARAEVSAESLDDAKDQARFLLNQDRTHDVCRPAADTGMNLDWHQNNAFEDSEPAIIDLDRDEPFFPDEGERAESETERLARLDVIYRHLSAEELAALVSRRLDGDAEDRREFATALAGTGLDDAARLSFLADDVRRLQPEQSGVRAP
jgi:hypothetical protein